MTDTAATLPGSETPVQDILGRLYDTARRDRVTLGDVVEAFGDRSFVPMLIVPALLVLSPLSGVPLFSSICGVTIAVISIQMLWPDRRYLWLPDRLMRRNVSGERARGAVARLCRVARWLDANARTRLRALVLTRPGRTILELACLFAGALMPFFEIVPFTSSILGFSVLLMATAILTRDGLFAVAGLAIFVAAPVVPFLLVEGLFGVS